MGSCVEADGWWREASTSWWRHDASCCAAETEGIGVSGLFEGLERGKYRAILVDPPWSFKVWSKETGNGRSAASHYSTMTARQIARLPVDELATSDCVLFMWCCWPILGDALRVIDAWDFVYKTCAFDWMKANNTQPDFFQDDLSTQMGMGYWTRANSEPCLLATRGNPKRVNADVRQGIITPRREHSRKPDCIYGRIEQLVAGPYVELFARKRHPGWDCWGNEIEKFEKHNGKIRQSGRRSGSASAGMDGISFDLS